MTKATNITNNLVDWSNGDESSLKRLIPLVESELKLIARRYLRRENLNHTLQTNDLVNEAYLKLVKQNRVTWQNRAHFFAISAKIMRRLLLNHARDKKAVKRGGGAKHLNIEEVYILTDEKSTKLIDLNESLNRLAKFDSLKSQIVEIRYFGGLTIKETAEVLNISTATVSLHWRLARVWLKKDMGI